MDLGLGGKVAIVTGSGRGIGRVIAKTFAREGTKLVIADLVEDWANKVCEELSAEGTEVLPVPLDVTDLSACEQMVEAALRRFGKVDILVNNAAHFGSRALFQRSNKQGWEAAIGVCQVGTMNCCKAVVDHMIARNYGRILSMSSDGARVGEAGMADYSGAKAAVIGFSKSLAREIGRYGITVNVVCPGITLSDEKRESMAERLWQNDEQKLQKIVSAYPLRKLGQAEDVAHSVVFLCSDLAGHITGQVLSVSGGFSMVG